MLDKLMKAINQKLDAHAAAVVAKRTLIERERAGDDARQHSGREFENSEGYTTPLPKAAQNAQAVYARARRDFEKNGGTSALALAVTMMIARERRDETAAALKKHEEAEARRRATGVHKEVEPFFDLMFDHGVEPRHLPYVRRETLAIVCDLIRWDGHDPDMQDGASPMPEVFGIYAQRLILEPGQFGDRTRSVPGKPSPPTLYTDPRHYRFDQLAQAAVTLPSLVEEGTQVSTPPVVPDNPVIVRGDSDPKPLSPARAQAIAEVIADTHPFQMPFYWPKDRIAVGEFDTAKLVPALQEWVDGGGAWVGAQHFLAAALDGGAREFIQERRSRVVQALTERLLQGDEKVLADAREVGCPI